MQIVDQPLTLPGYCVGCRAASNSDGRKFVDTGINVDYFGVIYICVPCILQLVREVNLSLPNDLRELQLMVKKLEEENDVLRLALSNLDFLAPSNRPRVSTVDSTVQSEGLEGTPEGGKEPSKRPTKPSTKQQSGSVRGSDSLERLLNPDA